MRRLKFQMLVTPKPLTDLAEIWYLEVFGGSCINPPIVKPFRLTYLAKGEGWSLEILTIACLTFCLLLTDRPTPGLPEYKLKVVNICKMHGTSGLEVVVL